jgi:serine/threonine protein phosphatase PrpC
MVAITHAGLTDPGRIRARNEDRWFAVPSLGLYGVTDGIAVPSAGELAAQIVATAVPPLLRQRLADCEHIDTPAASERVRSALADLSLRIREQADKQPGLDGMGATLALAVIRESQALIAHLGDSRVYLLRGHKLQRLTRDHTLAQVLVDCGEIPAAEAARHPGRDRLTRFVGMADQALPEIRLLPLCTGDRLLLCTDGLTNCVAARELATILHRHAAPEEACRRLVAAANTAGGSDNITAVVVAIQRC